MFKELLTCIFYTPFAKKTPDFLKSLFAEVKSFRVWNRMTEKLSDAKQDIFLCWGCHP